MAAVVLVVVVSCVVVVPAERHAKPRRFELRGAGKLGPLLAMCTEANVSRDDHHLGGTTSTFRQPFLHPDHEILSSSTRPSDALKTSKSLRIS